MKKTFYVLKDEEGVYRPMRFISPVDEAGELRKEDVRLHKGESIVQITMQEI